MRHLIWFAVLPALFAADLPYVGKWKMDPAKSSLTGTTIAYEQLAGGKWRQTQDGASYEFKMDGVEYPDHMGDTAAWKSINPNTWQAAWKTNGRAVATDTLRLGADGVLTITSKGTKPTGVAIDDVTTYQRVSGGPGLAGKWKSTSVKTSSPEAIEFAPFGGDGITFRSPAFEMSCNGKFDGKDYSCTGPLVSPGWTYSVTQEGPRAMTTTVKKDGKAMYRDTYTVSADGKTMTDTSSAVATGETMRIVYNRQ
jgi:hypothetical protein